MHPSMSIMVSQFNVGLTSSHLALFVSCGFSLLLFSGFEDDGFAVNMDSKADICPFFDFGPGICSLEAQVRKVVMQLIHACEGSVLTTDRWKEQQTDGWAETRINDWMKK